jgi:glycosyltransferase involved in cell wall biosynthesis
VIVFRPLCSPNVQKIVMDAIEANRLPLLVDSDDLILNRFAPQSSRARERASYEAGFRQLLDHASLITVSTTSLAAELQRSGYPSVPLVTRPSPRQIANDVEARHQSEIRIGFLGNPSHHLDLGSVLPALEEILESHSEVRLYWWGCRPGELAYHPQVRQAGPVITDYETHLQRLQAFGLDLAIVPLLDTPANRVKSAIKYYEFALAGIPAVYSNTLPYSACVRDDFTGLLAEDSTPSWKAAIHRLVSDRGLRARLADGAFAHVQHQMTDPTSLNEYRKIVGLLLSAAWNNSGATANAERTVEVASC